MKALFPLILTPTMTADEPTSTVMVPLAGKVRTWPACCTPLTRGTAEEELVTCTQQGPDVATTTSNLDVATV